MKGFLTCSWQSQNMETQFVIILQLENIRTHNHEVFTIIIVHEGEIRASFTLVLTYTNYFLQFYSISI
jgi:hypothetical protein